MSLENVKFLHNLVRRPESADSQPSRIVELLCEVVVAFMLSALATLKRRFSMIRGT
jgi:hypothetical protein